MEFTAKSIAGLALPVGKTDAIFFDDAMPGFGIRLRAGGKRAWVVQYRTAAGQRRHTIGDARRVDLKAAKAAAQKRFAEVALGGDPQAERAAARAKAAILLGPLMERYLAQKELHVRANTIVADRRYLLTYFKAFHRLAVDAVGRREVAAKLTEILADHGTTAAARARQSISAFFAWLVGEGIAESNPVIGTNNPGENLRARDRVLTNDELRVIWSASGDDEFGKIIKLLMLTAARRNEIGGLRWSELDLVDGMTLEIPGTRTKNHHPLRLTLPPAAVEVIRTVPQRPGRDLLFGGGAGPFSPWAWGTLSLRARIAEATGQAMTPWTLHDIRRTVATGMAELGVAPWTVETVLNHRSGHKAGVAGVYNRATYEAEVRQALALWADHLLSIVAGTERKVVSLRSAR